jgi:teichuronic acid exporter
MRFLLKSKFDFLFQVITLGIGSSVGQLITIGVSPILTRLYTPEDFGVWAFYISVVSIFSIIATGKYELAIVLPKSNDEAMSLVILIFFLSCSVSFFLLVIMIFFKSSIELLLGNISFENAFFLLPLNVLLVGLTQACIYWEYRQKHYKNLMYNRMGQSSITAAIHFSLGVVSNNAMGLILGTIAGQCLAFILLLKKIYLYEKKSISINFLRIVPNASRYKNFLFYSMPMGILNVMSFNLLQYTLIFYFSSSALGYYYLVQRILNIPLDIISSSFAPVFYRELSNIPSKQSFMLKAFFGNFLLVCLWLLPFLFFGEEIFSYIFGIQWKDAGKMCSLLAPLIIMSFASGSISSIFSYFQKNEILLYWQVIYFLGFALLVFLYQDDFNNMIKISSYFGALMYLVLFFLAYKLACHKEQK